MKTTVYPLLELDNVSVTFTDSEKNEIKTLVNFSLKLQAGELAVVIGDSGSGKSTLLNLVAGFFRNQDDSHNQGLTGRIRKVFESKQKKIEVQGHVLVNGKDICSLEPRERPIGLVMQRFSLYPHMTVRQNLEFPLRMRRVPKKDWNSLIMDVVTKLDIKDLLNRSVEKLSGGQMQRVAIGKMILRNPQIALLDEAFSHLDPKLRSDLRKSVIDGFLNQDQINERGIIFVSHDLADAERADKIIVLSIVKDDLTSERLKTRHMIFSGNDSVSAWETMLKSTDPDIVKLIATIPHFIQK